MSPNSDSGPTELLRAWSQGDGSALDRLMPLVYDELHGLAQRYMRQERPDHTLQATSLVNEAYLRLIDVNRVEWQNRTHFLAVAAQMMRRILVEFARNRHRQKRGGGAVHLSLDDVLELPESPERDLVALSDALTGLATFDARMGQVVELRFFGGLTVEETAQVFERVTRDRHAGLEDRKGVAPPRDGSRATDCFVLRWHAMAVGQLPLQRLVEEEQIGETARTWLDAFRLSTSCNPIEG